VRKGVARAGRSFLSEPEDYVDHPECSNAIGQFIASEAAIKARHAIVVVMLDADGAAQSIHFNTVSIPATSDQEQLITDIKTAETVVQVVLESKTKKSGGSYYVLS